MEQKVDVKTVRWLLNKKFKHFDKPYQCTKLAKKRQYCIVDVELAEKIKQIVSSPSEVATHSFYPFIAFDIQERRVRKIKEMKEELCILKEKLKHVSSENEKKEISIQINDLESTFKEKINKKRPIRYASHVDGHIYAYYASQILLPKYEEKIKEYDLDNEILAYRKVPEKTEGDYFYHPRLNNITMARDAFKEIIKRNCDCVALAYDLKSFYDNIDHKILKQMWCLVLGTQELPPDHYNLYKSLTRYCFIDLKKVCEFFLKNTVCKNCDCAKCKSPKTKKLPKILFKEAKDFREFKKWCGKGNIKKNPGLKNKVDPYGIPQGSALSALLSNIYMLSFDIDVKKFLQSKNAIYRRYCDDILIICDHEKKDEINTFLLSRIEDQGKHLKIHPFEEDKRYSKSKIYDFRNKEEIEKNPLQYLGFCFDGTSVTIRGSSLSRFYRKAHRGIIAARYSAIKKLYQLFKKDKLQEKNKKIFRRHIYELYSMKGHNNFHSYAKRAFDQMEGINNRKFQGQLKGHLKKIVAELSRQDAFVERAFIILKSSPKDLTYKDYTKAIYNS